MRFLWATMTLVSLSAWGTGESFKIQLHDNKVRVEAPAKATPQFAVIVENHSLSDVTGKFSAAGRDLKFVSVKTTQSKVVEFSHKGPTPVSFKCLTPSFQEVLLVFGKGSYEIPPKQ